MSDTQPGGVYLDTMTLKTTPLREKLRIIAEAGYDGVRIRGNDVVEFTSSGGSAADLGRLLRELDLPSPGFVTEADVYDWHLVAPDDRDFETRLHAALEVCSVIGARCALFPVMQAEGGLERLLENFIRVCRRANERQLQVGLEFIGHIPKVPDVRTAWQIVERADQPNGGLVIDLFHFYRGGSRLEDLERLPLDRLFMVDLDDAMPLAREQLLGFKHRLYPGRGVAPVRAVVAALKWRGFAGPWVVELFNEDYWAADPREVAAVARRETASVLGEDAST